MIADIVIFVLFVVVIVIGIVTERDLRREIAKLKDAATSREINDRVAKWPALSHWNKPEPFLNVYFAPRSDITALELARILACKYGSDPWLPNSAIKVTQRNWAAMSPELQRHFSLREPS